MPDDNASMTISIPTPDGSAEAFVVRPPGPPRGAVLLFMDAIGLRPRIAEMMAEIAASGWVVLAPNVFYRAGTVDELAPTTDLRDPAARAAFFDAGAMDRVSALTPDLAARDAEGWMAALEPLHPAGTPIVAVGFCMGARLAVRAAAQFADSPTPIVAVGGFHGGGLATDAADSPHRLVDGRIRYLFGHADHDGSMTPENAAELDRALVEAGAEFTSAIYPEAPHGYTMADTSTWHAPSYERYRSELAELLSRY